MQASVPSSQVPVLHEVELEEQSSAGPEHVPVVQVSGSVQNRLSVQLLPSSSFAVQAFAPSSQVSEQSPSPSGPSQGSVPPVQVPLEHVSPVVQKAPSEQALPLVSFVVQVSVASLHVSEQSESPSAPGHGSPAWVEQVPEAQVSAPLQ